MTKVICTATLDDDLPRWLKEKKTGWITAEYGMLPGSTNTRNKRESRIGRQSGRTIEIQRLIGRSLRSVVELEKLNGFQVILDCDVIQADGGTRTASISGSFVALNLALKKFIKKNFIKSNPVKDYVAAISCGIVNGKVLVDLDYDEDSSADVDANFIMTKKSGFSEIQISGENSTFSYQSVSQMVDKTKKIVNQIFDIQKNAIK
tara:strand:+ start:233 stop:847 length:615 start_codon:yes stop_codon:yes gene_type:complete